ncbi:hypothetical protein ACP2AV_03185 [Aliiroseovarius sp. PTFE2010]|uniref:hypothetical protein n=1 Tax=Aliiroseovarius sp. PTFE2010 TaxID=3417190 RepID=UPI003CF6346D
MDYVLATLAVPKGVDDVVLLFIAGSTLALCGGAVALKVLHGRGKARKPAPKEKLPKVALPLAGSEDRPGGRFARKGRNEDPFITRLNRLT